MSTPEATVVIAGERSQQWHDSLHAVFNGLVHLETVDHPRGLATYLEGYNPDFDQYSAGLCDRERAELNAYLGGVKDYARGYWGDNLGPMRRSHNHPLHSEIIRPIRYQRREVTIAPVDDFNPEIELVDGVHTRLSERRFDGALHARYLGRGFVFSAQDPMYEVSVYKPEAGQRRLSYALAFHPARKTLALSRVALRDPSFIERHSGRGLEAMFDGLVDLMQIERVTGSLAIRHGYPAIAA